MLSFIIVLVGVGLLIALGMRFCLYLHRAGVLKYGSGRRLRRSRREPEPVQAAVIDHEAEEALAKAQTEYLADLVNSL